MVSLINLPESHLPRIEKSLKEPDKACHLIFRLLGTSFQRDFEESFDLTQVPNLFIHGNPHLDNYVRTFSGAGLVDFDRSRLGPYSWDIIRFLSSVTLRGEKKKKDGSINDDVVESFLTGYERTLQNPDLYFVYPTFLRSLLPTEQEFTMNSYLDANIKWAKKMRKNPQDVKDKKLNKMLELYLKSRNEMKLLNFYELKECGVSEGSLGKLHYLFALRPKDGEGESAGKKDAILIDLKETYCEEDTKYFKNPTDHHGLRMIRASNLYAPGIEQRLGYFTFEKNEYWGREVPSFNGKIKELLSVSEQDEIAYCIGAQLGRGHRRSLKDGTVKEILEDLKINLPDYIEFAKTMNLKVLHSLEYLQKLNDIE